MPKIIAPTVAEHRERVYDALLDAVHGLVIEKGFEAVTLGDIAVRAGVSRTAIYNYAPDKAALLLAAVERASTEMRSAIAETVADQERTPAQRLEALVELLLVVYTPSAHDLILIRAVHDVFGSEGSTPLQQVIRGHLARLIEEGIARGDFVAEDAELAVDFLSAVLDEAIVRAMADPDAAPAVAQATADFLRGALAGS